MKKVIICCVLSLLVGALTAQATPYTYTSTVTADNHYAIYTGNSSSINYIGTNESGSTGSPGTYNWSSPENFTFDVNSGDYIYVAGWSDDSVAQGWIGQFVSSTGTILSNATDWQALLTYSDIDDGGAAPTVVQFQNDITKTGASWSNITNTLDNGASPWGTIGTINSNADWIWGSAMEPGNGFGEYQVFRTQVAPAPVPEPATMTLLGIGMLGAGLAARKRNRKSKSTD